MPAVGVDIPQAVISTAQCRQISVRVEVPGIILSLRMTTWTTFLMHLQTENQYPDTLSRQGGQLNQSSSIMCSIQISMTLLCVFVVHIIILLYDIDSFMRMRKSNVTW